MSKRLVQVQNSPKGSTNTRVKTRRTSVIPGWADIPEWDTQKCPLLDMPVEILDQIFRPENDLKLQDHMAFAGTCRQIRRAYTDDIWEDVGPSDDYDCSLQAKIATDTNGCTITTSGARSSYKLTENEVLSIPFETRPNPHSRGAAPMKLFRRARVYALAMCVHGGPQGHKAHLKKLAIKSTKAKATREKNGTVSVKKTHGYEDYD